MNKKTLFILLLSISSASLAATNNPACERKAKNIEDQIQYAQKHGNDHRVKGLEIALSELNMHCTDKNLLSEAQDKLEKKQKKVNERIEELNEAKQTGNSDKISKKEQKLQYAQNELKEAKADLQSIME
ncbi:DUF1090 domain-containing protein [Providencia rettgeri]|uniref:DUF1090 domain-containing protein n=1 Tax=Providencia rettgeri TaxID=587 RepID=UPI001B3668E9|nr:DUF1090 domain-containing protein [Providencia rettgeri]MBQ0369044.1 DUF1090 domain-containing protein [Providencia rettgeri]